MSYSSLGIITPKPIPRGRRLHRFWFRTLSLILAPLLITIYFFYIWQFLLRGDGPVKYGTFNESWVFYSWFVLGVFGLSISRYGILGIEAAMLQEPFWQTKTAMNLLMHSGGTWGGAGGWARCIFWSIRYKRSIAGRLWYLLSLITMSLFVGLPISGLSLELTDGYIHSTDHPKVVGHTWYDFNLREALRAESRGLEAWKTGSAPSLPGLGLAYTPSYLKRDDLSFLSEVPNSLPSDRGVPELFLAPQADVPISGEAWGLRFSYNCSLIESSSDLKILNRKSSFKWKYLPPKIPFLMGFTDAITRASIEGNKTLYLFSSSSTVDDVDLRDTRPRRNLWAYGELATDRKAVSGWDSDGNAGDSKSSSSDSDGVFFEGTLEYVLWQVGLTNNFEPAFKSLEIEDPSSKKPGGLVVDFDDKVEPSIKNLDSPLTRNSNGTWGIDESNFGGVHQDTIYNDIFLPGPDVRALAEPIGVQCRHRSALGTAQLDARTTTFSAFTPTPPPFFNGSEMDFRVAPFGGPAEQILAGHYFHIFPSVNSPPPVSSANSLFYKTYVRPEMLLESARRAYAMDALQLMYDGLPGLNGAYLNENLTSSRKGKVLELGIIPPIIPAVWLGTWAFVCALLGFRYGFLRRWSASLDGFSLFRLGADFADELRELSSTGAFEECERLWDLPGFVGDAKRGYDVGYISLVSKDEVAEKGRLYV